MHRFGDLPDFLFGKKTFDGLISAFSEQVDVAELLETSFYDWQIRLRDRSRRVLVLLCHKHNHLIPYRNTRDYSRYGASWASPRHVTWVKSTAGAERKAAGTTDELLERR